MRRAYTDTPKRKPCSSCGRPALRLYRIRHDASGAWDFVCDDCWPKYSTNNPHYVYGGTWKGTRHKVSDTPGGDHD